MARKNPFTEEQMRILEQNKYTHSVTPQRLVFTLEFKQFFLDQVRNHGKKTSAILKEAGYDITLFKRGNIETIRQHILNEANSETGLRPPRGLSTAERIAAFEQKDLAQQSTDASIRELQERIVHLEKQVEFLKKTSYILNTPVQTSAPAKKQDGSLL